MRRLLLCSLFFCCLEVHCLNVSSSCGEGNPVRVLITGISGMIGSHVTRALLGRKGCSYKIFGLVRPRTDLSALAGLLSSVELVLGDITDSVRMVEVFKISSPALVFHFAAQAINGISFQMAHLSLNTNV